MAQVSVEVPAVVVGVLRETAVLLYQATVEALHLALRAHGERPDALEEIHEHRARLEQVDALLAQLGWTSPPAERALRLMAPVELLHDALHGALIDAGERLAVACAARWDGEPSTEDVRVAGEQVIALDRLVQSLEGGS